MPEETSTQYVAYTLYKADPAWLRLPIEERAAAKEAFAETIEDWAERMELRSYSLVGVRPEADFMLWKLTERYDDLRELGTALNATPLAGWLTTPYSYLAEEARVVRAVHGRPTPRDAGACVDRQSFRHDHEPHDVLVRDR